MVLSPTAQDHSLDYRSATFHLDRPRIVPDTDPVGKAEKRQALADILDTVVGYDRTAVVGPSDDYNMSRLSLVKCKIKAVSCKQRMGGWNGGKEPVVDGPPDRGFTGVVPCWTQWGAPIGFGKDAKEVEEHFREKSLRAQRLAEGAAWASEAATLEGLGKKRTTKR